MNYVDAIFYGADGNGESETGSADAVRFTPQILTPAQQTQARENIGGEAAVRIIPVAGQEVTITPEHNCVYQCGELLALTITNPPETGTWAIRFSSGAEAATTSIPEAVLGLERFAARPNVFYEINVLDNRALYHGWAVPAQEEAEHAGS